MRPAIVASMSSGVAPNPLRFASRTNRYPARAEAHTGANTEGWTRWPVWIGSGDMSELVLSFGGVYLGGTTDANLPNGYTINEVALERDSPAAYTPVTFGGSRSKAIAAGDYDIQSDPILPSAFGLSSFARGSKYWIRVRYTVPSGGSVPVIYGSRDGDSWNISYNPATFTHGPVDATGAPTYSGTGFAFLDYFGSVPIVLGRPVLSTVKAFAGFGDSIMEFANDSTDGTQKQGFFARSLVGADGVSTVRGGCNFAAYGSTPSLIATSPKALSMLAYCTHLVDEYGTNQADQTSVALIWAAAAARGKPVIRTKLLARTTSTDSWATAANQTYHSAGWTPPSGEFVTFNDWLDSKLSDGTIQYLVDFASVALDGSNRWKWLSNGSGNYATDDGLHPSPTIHAAMAGVMRTQYNALP